MRWGHVLRAWHRSDRPQGETRPARAATASRQLALRYGQGIASAPSRTPLREGDRAPRLLQGSARRWATDCCQTSPEPYGQCAHCTYLLVGCPQLHGPAPCAAVRSTQLRPAQLRVARCRGSATGLTRHTQLDVDVGQMTLDRSDA